MKSVAKLVGIITLLSCAVASAQNYTVEVGTTSTVIVPMASPPSNIQTVWSNGLVVAQGDYVVNTNAPTRTYWAVTAGTSTVMPTHAYFTATGADAIEWLYIPNNNASRKNSIIFADINTTTYYSDVEATATTACSILDAVRPARSFPRHKGDVKAVVEAGTATIAVELDY